MQLDNPVTAAAVTPTPARDAAGPSRPRSWLVHARVAARAVVIQYTDADRYHEAVAAVAALDAEERQLRAALRTGNAPAAEVGARLRALAAERAAQVRRMRPDGEVQAPIRHTATGPALGPCSCRFARWGRACDHLRLARLALEVWQARGAARGTPSVASAPPSPAAAPTDGEAPEVPYVDPGVAADDLAPRHILPRWCYTAEGVRRPLAEAVALLEDCILPLERECARRGVLLPGVPASAESLRRAYATSWEPISWLPPLPDGVPDAVMHPREACRPPLLTALERSVLTALRDGARSYRELSALSPEDDGALGRALGRLQMLGFVEVEAGRYRATEVGA